jgi:serine/threonine protein kinase
MVSSGRRYEIEIPLGKGGFGTVYRARFVGEGGFSKVVALKVLNENMSDLEEVLARLRDEARLLGMLRHRAIVSADRLVRLANRWAVVMEYVEGADLKRIVKESKVPVGAAVEILGEVAGALHSAWHTQGPDGKPLHLIHRDIKPSNIVLTSYGEIKVLDFGIARADFGEREAETKAFGMGSLPYMAPERLDFLDTAAADVYALGVVFFELVTGRAFGRASANPDRHTKHVNAALRFLVEQGVGNRDLLLFLGSLLAYDPDDRPTARQLERMCVNLRRRFDDEPLRYWAEQVVPGILVDIAKLPADSLTGSALVEQTEGTFAELPAGPVNTNSGTFSRPVGGQHTGSSSLGSGSFARPMASVSTGSASTDGVRSGAFQRPVGQNVTGSTGTGTGRSGFAPAPAPPPPPSTTTMPGAMDRSGELGPAITPEPGSPQPAASAAPVGPAQTASPSPSAFSMRTAVLAVLLVLLLLTVGVGVGIAVMKAGDSGGHRAETTPTQPVEPSPAEPSPAEPPPLDAAPEPEQPAEVAPSTPPRTPRSPEAAEAPASALQSVVAASAGSSSGAVGDKGGASAAPDKGQGSAQPADEQAEQPAAATTPTARVEVAGDAEAVVLVGAAGSFRLPATVPEGSYTIRATFPGRDALVAGRAAVHGGVATTVRCSAGFTRCKAQ